MDPLRPFTDLIRSLSRQGSKKTTRQDPNRTLQRGRSSGTNAVVNAGASESIQAQICSRITERGATNPVQRRAIFVETVLAQQLGSVLIGDPGFEEVVRKITDQIGSNPIMSQRLDHLLQTLPSSAAKT